MRHNFLLSAPVLAHLVLAPDHGDQPLHLIAGQRIAELIEDQSPDGVVARHCHHRFPIGAGPSGLSVGARRRCAYRWALAADTVQHLLTNPALAEVLDHGRRPKAGNPQAEVVRVEDFFPSILSAQEWVTFCKSGGKSGVLCPAGKRTHLNGYCFTSSTTCRTAPAGCPTEACPPGQRGIPGANAASRAAPQSRMSWRNIPVGTSWPRPSSRAFS